MATATPTPTLSTPAYTPIHAHVLAAGNPNPTTPPFSNDVQWITAYLAVHMLSVPSRRYSYILWFVIAFVLVTFAALHLTGSRGGYLGACWTKWAIQRPTWRKGRKKPQFLPSRAQILSLTALFVVTAVLCCVGPDYIMPTQSTFSPSKRSNNLERRMQWDPLQFIGYAPQYTIQKAWWSAGGRLGMMAYTLFPLCVLFSLKGSPFALFSLKFTAQLFFDKLAFLHRWTAYLIWLLVALHTAFWTKQLATDRRTSVFADASSRSLRDVPLDLAWSYTRFLYAWIAFGLLTLLLLTSMAPIRKYHYETFWFLHALLVPLTLVLSALHHPPIWWWCWAALFLWLGERIWRGVRWLRINGVVGGPVPPKTPGVTPRVSGAFGRDLESDFSNQTLFDSVQFPLPTVAPKPLHATVGKHAHDYPPSPPSAQLTPLKGHFASPSASSMDTFLSAAPGLAYVPPPGFAHAELLAGNTVRLTFVPARPIVWAPGQHFLITVPAVTTLTSHPFTAASICDSQAPCDEGREIVLLVRAKAGWTKDLWDEVAALVVGGRVNAPGEHLPKGAVPPKRGCLLRMWIDGPFGSSVRTKWGQYSTAVIVCGGSGVSFGLSILEYLCLCMTGRDGKHLGGHAGSWGKINFRTRRVRFIWLIREYSHVQWCASIIRRCVELIPAPGLQIDIFVTNAATAPRYRHPHPKPLGPPASVSTPATPTFTEVNDHLAPPSPRFARRAGGAGSGESSPETGAEDNFDLSYYVASPGAEDDSDITDLTNWEGDNDTVLPGEKRLSKQVKQAGRHRRTFSRRMSRSTQAKQALDALPEKDIVPDEKHARTWEEKKRGHASRSSEVLFAMSPLTEEQDDSSYEDVRLVPKRESRSLSPQPLERNPQTHPLQQNDPAPQGQAPPYTEHLPHGHSPLAPASSASPPAGRGAQRQSWVSARRQSWTSGQNHHPVSPTEDGTDDGSTAFSRPTTPGAWSSRGLLSDGSSSPSPHQRSTHRRHESDIRLEVETREMHDMSIVSEFVRPGRPRLDHILAEEVERSKGAVVVACCGPTSLNAVMRNAIAKQVNPARVRKGDMRGSITLVSEEFEY